MVWFHESFFLSLNLGQVHESNLLESVQSSCWFNKQVDRHLFKKKLSLAYFQAQ